MAYSAVVQDRLASYLRDNQDEVIENWLTGAAIPEGESLPRGAEHALLEELTIAFEQVMDALVGKVPNRRHNRQWAPSLLLQAGVEAFAGVLAEEWDVDAEFSASERAEAIHTIERLLQQIFDETELARAKARAETRFKTNP